jgi:CO/xanthine dehydrogenase FAD-binding subunit
MNGGLLPNARQFASMGSVVESLASVSSNNTTVKTPFQYHRPSSVPEACQLLLELGPQALPLAGGTDVLVDIRRGAKRPRHLVSLAELEELRGMDAADGEWRIGALITPAQLEASKSLCSARPEFLDVVGVFGSPQVRRRATVGGSLCTAASCGDLAPLLVALDARVELVGPEGRRELALEAFFSDHRNTRLGPGELLVKVIIPVREEGDGAAYQAFGLRAENFITVAGVAASLRMEEGVCTRARLALGAVAPTPVLVPGVEERLLGGEVGEGVIRDVALAARAASAPISDLRGSAEHRRELVEALCERALHSARERAQ